MAKTPGTDPVNGECPEKAIYRDREQTCGCPGRGVGKEIKRKWDQGVLWVMEMC